MKKSVLIAVDDSLQATQVLGYAARLAADIPELHYELLYIQPAVSGYLRDEAERSLKARNELESLLQKNQRAGHALLEKYRGSSCAWASPPSASAPRPGRATCRWPRISWS